MMNPWSSPDFGLMHSFGAPLFGLTFLPILAIVLAWTFVWKGLALWHAARNKQTIWFVVLLLLNTVGIVDIIYLLFFRKNNTGDGMGTPSLFASSQASSTSKSSSDTSVPSAE